MKNKIANKFSSMFQVYVKIILTLEGKTQRLDFKMFIAKW